MELELKEFKIDDVNTIIVMGDADYDGEQLNEFINYTFDLGDFKMGISISEYKQRWIFNKIPDIYQYTKTTVLEQMPIMKDRLFIGVNLNSDIQNDDNLKNIVYNARHLNTSLMMTSLYPLNNRVSPYIRQRTDTVAIMPTKSKGIISDVWKQWGDYMSLNKEEFNRLMEVSYDENIVIVFKIEEKMFEYYNLIAKPEIKIDISFKPQSLLQL